MLVENVDERFDIGDFGQRHLDQAAYDEAFLTLDGESVLSRLSAPEESTLRVTFFLHFFDPAQPLTTSYGEMEMPEVQIMPERLKSLLPYEPIG